MTTKLHKPIVAIGKAILPSSARFYLRTVQNCPRVQIAYLKRGKFIKALRGFKVYLHLVANLLSVLRLLPRRRHCEFCDWGGFSFVPIYYVDCYRADVFCPNCRLMDRYRTLVHFIRRSEWAARLRQLRPRVLDVAPTESSRKMLLTEFSASESVGFDLSNPWADVTGDLQAMPFESESFDLFLCYEVLDYIPNDNSAIRELHRVLKPGSYGFLRVGFDTEQAETTEYAQPDTDDSYHIRRYGRDLPDRFHAAGFVVELIDLSKEASREEQMKYGLDRYPVFLLRRPPS